MTPRLLNLTDWRGAQIALTPSSSGDGPTLWLQVREESGWVALEVDQAQAIRIRDALSRWIDHHEVHPRAEATALGVARVAGERKTDG